MAKWVYMFTEGNADMRNLLGGKGANLAEMTNLGLPVPQGFTVTTEACTQYYEDGRQINDEIMAQIMEAIDKMEGITGKKFGDKENPLLVSVYIRTYRKLQKSFCILRMPASFYNRSCIRNRTGSVLRINYSNVLSFQNFLPGHAFTGDSHQPRSCVYFLQYFPG